MSDKKKPNDRTRKMTMVQLYSCPTHGMQIKPRCEDCRPCATPQLYSHGNDKDNPR